MKSKDNYICPSCESKFTGNFCSKCGEKRKATSFTFREFISSSLEAIYNFDSKFMRSLKLLLFKQGFLTVEFIRGSRVKYLRPLQLFVIMNIIMFFALSFTNSSIITTNFYMQTNLTPFKSFTKNLINNENAKLDITLEE
ncbi:MAG: DUF3667 domain-containing protein [Ignavibacteriae bacterium]|nr:DUF3667 domain-containing protein [Ignavibacteriota bacterium]